MDIAKGNYIQFVDADDWITEDCCEYLWLYAQIKRTDMLLFGASCFDEKSQKVVNNPYYNFEYLPEISEETIMPRSNVGRIPSMCNSVPLAFFKRSFLLSNKLNWSDKGIYYEDIPFFTKCIFKANRVAFFRDKFYFHRLHSMGVQEKIRYNFSDFCQSICLTLQYVHDCEHKEAFMPFLNYYAGRVLEVYKGLPGNTKNAHIKDMYDFVGFVYSLAHIRLSAQFERLAWQIQCQ